MRSPVLTTDPDGTLRYDCEQGIAIRVALHRRNGTHKCPVEVLHQGATVLSTDTNLRDLRDIENVLKHVKGLLGKYVSPQDMHIILTTVASALPETAHAPWSPLGQPLSAYAITRRDYLWYPWLLKGEPCSLEGDPNVGKTAVLIKLLAHLTSGTHFPTLFPDHPEDDFEPATVVLFTNEDSPHKTLHPRLVLNEGDPDRVIFMEGKKDPATGTVVPMSLQDLGLLEQVLTAHTPALLCFDPIQSYLGADVDMNQAASTRPLLDAVSALCAAHDCTPFYIRHNGKTQRTKAIHSALGSIDIAAHMRSVLTLYKDPDDKQRRILAHTKHPGRPAPSMNLKFTRATLDVETDAGTETIEEVRLNWDGKNDLTSEDLNMRETLHRNDTAETNSALEQARDFLREVLTEGPMLVDDIRLHAKKAGVSEASLRRAKEKEHYKARRRPQDDQPCHRWSWEWYAPTSGQ